MGLSARHAEILEARGLDVEMMAQYGAQTFDQGDGDDWISIPYMMGGVQVNTKYRTIGGTKKFHQEAKAKKCFWNFDAITDETLSAHPLIIVEGELDAFAAIQAGFPRVVSVPDGAPAEAIGEEDRGTKYSYLAEAMAYLRDEREIILATDNDGPGVNLLNDLAMRIGKVRCKWIRYPKGCKDLGDALKAWGARGVVQSIGTAQWMQVDGVYRMSELPPIAPSIPFEIGIVGFEPHYRIRMGDFCIITGVPSHGKSTLTNEIVCRLVQKHGWNVAMASFEQKPQVDHRRNLRTFHGGRYVKDMTPDEIEAADRWIDRYFSFIVPSEDDEVTLAWTLERCAAAILRNGARVVVIDPWNEMDHNRPPDMSVTEYTGFAIKQFKKLATKYQVHVIVVAHPAKIRRDESGKTPMPTLYDVADSANWYNKPDIGIIVHRKEEGRTIIRVAKSRYHDQIGKPGDILATFNPETGRYTVIEDEYA